MARGMRRRLVPQGAAPCGRLRPAERSGLFHLEALAQMFLSGRPEDILQLRTRALTNRSARRIFAHLLHLAQRRGFKSNRRTASDGEDGRLLAAVNEKPPAHGPGRLAHRGRNAVPASRLSRFTSAIRLTITFPPSGGIWWQRRPPSCSSASVQWAAAGRTGAAGEYLPFFCASVRLTRGRAATAPTEATRWKKWWAAAHSSRMSARGKTAYSFEYFSLLQKLNNIRLCGKRRNAADAAAAATASRWRTNPGHEPCPHSQRGAGAPETVHSTRALPGKRNALKRAKKRKSSPACPHTTKCARRWTAL